jgi:hypothetical protein
VIVQPAPPAASSPQKRPPHGWSRFWSVAKVAGPALTAVIALVISLLAYNDQHSADTAASMAARRQDASLVSWYQGPSDTVVIVNASARPIFGLILYSVILAWPGTIFQPKAGWIAGGSLLPECSQITLKLAGLQLLSDDTQQRKIATVPADVANGVLFEDILGFRNSDGRWQINFGGYLSSGLPGKPHYQPAPYSIRTQASEALSRNTTVKPSPTCS